MNGENLQANKTNQAEKARLGAVGENQVVSMLMQHGWDAFNANCTIKNFKSIDIVCLNSEIPEDAICWWKPKTALIQVKTSVQKNIPTGFSIEDSLDVAKLEKQVKGAYVFVYVDTSKDVWSFRYFIISRKQFIKLIYAAHDWYDNGYKREKSISTLIPQHYNLIFFIST